MIGSFRRGPILVMICILSGILFLVCFDFDIIISEPGVYYGHNGDIIEEDIGLIPPKSSKQNQDFITHFLEYFPHNSQQDIYRFLGVKENIYSQRRHLISHYCQEKQSGASPDFGTTILRNTLVYDNKDLVAYCEIPKVASSTWCNHFIELANPPERERKRWRQALQLYAPKLWPQPTNDKNELAEEWAKTTSIVIVRHPLSRLVSVYFQKFVSLKDNKGWKRISRHIVKMYRNRVKSTKLEDVDESVPTPEEMVRFVLMQLSTQSGRIDPHWRPQHLSCPFCLLNFTIYARQEELEEDTAYFAIKSGLGSKIQTDARLNRMNSTTKERNFWSIVDPQLLGQIQSEWAYGLDFLMFGYSIRDYLDDLSIPYDRQLIQI